MATLLLGAGIMIFSDMFLGGLPKISINMTEGKRLPYMCYIGMCHCAGYGFQAIYSRIGYINQSIWVQNRVSFFRKLISWYRGDLGSLL